MVLHAMSLLVMRRLQVEIELLRDQGEMIVIPPPCPIDVSPIDFSRAGELIERALVQSRDFLDRIESGEISDPTYGLAVQAAA
jgi:NTE family protein